MLALGAMSNAWQAVFFVIAFILFIAAGLNAITRVNLLAFGLASFVLVFAYNAVARA